jgi:hypothetical protein
MISFYKTIIIVKIKKWNNITIILQKNSHRLSYFFTIVFNATDNWLSFSNIGLVR